MIEMLASRNPTATPRSKSTEHRTATLKTCHVLGANGESRAIRLFAIQNLVRPTGDALKLSGATAPPETIIVIA